MNLPTIYLFRHGETVWNVEGRYQGQLDSPLTEKGKKQALDNVQKLKKYITLKDRLKFYSSPLGRAKATAEIMVKELKIPLSTIIFEDRIQEFNYGIFEGETKTYCKRKFSDEFEARESDKWNYLLEGGESYVMVTKRLKSWLESVQDEKIIVIVAHEMINRALRGLYLNLNNKDILKLFQANNVLIKLENGRETILN